MRRQSWYETWMATADVMAERSLCSRRKAGCVLVSATNQVVATGYNGAPRGLRVHGPCSDWCPRALTGGGMSYDDCYAVHAETNALLRSNAQLLDRGTAFVTSCPCFACAKSLANSGILDVVCRIGEVDIERQPERSLKLMRDSGLAVFVQREDGVLIPWTG